MKVGQKVSKTPAHPAGCVVSVGKVGYTCLTSDGKRFMIRFTKKPVINEVCPHLNKACRFLYDGIELMGIFVNKRQVKVLQHPVWANTIVTPKQILEMLG